MSKARGCCSINGASLFPVELEAMLATVVQKNAVFLYTLLLCTPPTKFRPPHLWGVQTHGSEHQRKTCDSIPELLASRGNRFGIMPFYLSDFFPFPVFSLLCFSFGCRCYVVPQWLLIFSVLKNYVLFTVLTPCVSPSVDCSSDFVGLYSNCSFLPSGD